MKEVTDIMETAASTADLSTARQSLVDGMEKLREGLAASAPLDHSPNTGKTENEDIQDTWNRSFLSVYLYFFLSLSLPFSYSLSTLTGQSRWLPARAEALLEVSSTWGVSPRHCRFKLALEGSVVCFFLNFINAKRFEAPLHVNLTLHNQKWID